MTQYYPVLTIAGSDSSGGAGIQADIKSICANGCYAMSAITAVTAQNTTGVTAMQSVDPGLVAAQIGAVVSDIPPLSVKTGMLANAAIIDVVADAADEGFLPNLIVDPVMVSTSGSRLLEPAAVDTLRTRLIPRALLVTPNRREAEILTSETDPVRQARALIAMGAQSALITGGDAEEGNRATDILVLTELGNPRYLRSDTVDTVNTHGTGCSLSAAIAARLALGDTLEQAVRSAKMYVTMALYSSADVKIGRGHGPMNHFFAPERQKKRPGEPS